MNETHLSQKFMPVLKGLCDACRVENVAENGTPDINYAGERTQGWIETKVFHGAYLHFERFQIPWFRRRCRATGGRYVWLLATDFASIALYRAVDLLECPTSVRGKWTCIHRDNLPERLTGTTWERPDWRKIMYEITNES
jgi:hypothetical protein